MRAHYLQHVPFEGLGSIESWLHRAGYEITNTRFYESSVALPDIEAVDLLVVLGGPMSVNDERAHPWLVKEKQFIQSAIAAGRPTLGICLGAQLIACAMGGKVFPNPVKEIGWYPIQGAQSRDDAMFRFPDEMEVFHWHGETFNLPNGAVRLASSRACSNQAFQLGENVIGLQFHLETTPQSALDIVGNCRDELIAGEYIQTEIEILCAPKEKYESINHVMCDVIEYLLRKNS